MSRHRAPCQLENALHSTPQSRGKGTHPGAPSRRVDGGHLRRQHCLSTQPTPRGTPHPQPALSPHLYNVGHDLLQDDGLPDWSRIGSLGTRGDRESRVSPGAAGAGTEDPGSPSDGFQGGCWGDQSRISAGISAETW